jgi:branched-chain amino acid transport system ATP-binding protein
MLKVQQIETYYSQIHVLKGVSVAVPSGQITTILGANGAGKTTLLKTISGVIQPKSGKILFDGRDITFFPPERIVGLGISQVPEGRQIFGPLTVLSNLRLGAYVRSSKSNQREVDKDLIYVQEVFPILGTRLKQKAGSLSGGEQQMLAIARALMSRPRLLLLDEPSLGLAPLIVEEIFRVISHVLEKGTTVLLVEQNAPMALEISQFAYVLETGRVVHEGPPSTLVESETVQRAYLGDQAKGKENHVRPDH